MKVVRRLKNNLIVIILLSALPLVVFPDVSLAKDKKNQPLIKTAVNKNLVGIGDKIQYVITVSADKGIQVEFPNLSGTMADFSINNFGLSKKEFFGRKKLVQRYLLKSYKTGKYTIPKAVLRYKRSSEQEWSQIETEPIQIQVKSLLAETKALNIRDIKGPIEIGQGLFFYFIIICVLLVLALLIGLGLFFIKKRRLANALVHRLAHEIAYEKLEELKKRDLAGQGKIKEYYIELSDIVRHYLEDRFSLRAPEMSTEEFLFKIRDSNKLIREHKNLLKEFLSKCDLVKFAKYGPDRSEIDSSFECAKKFVDQTIDIKKEETA